MRVLLIDDAAMVRVRLRDRLTAAGADVLEAGHATQVAALAGASLVDFVIIDVHAPNTGVDGLSLLRGQLPEAVVIVLTNEANELHRRECLARGADYFFDKSREFERAMEIVLVAHATPAS